MLELVIYPEMRESSMMSFGSRNNSVLRTQENEWNKNYSKRYDPENRIFSYCPNIYKFSGMNFYTHADIYGAIDGSKINLCELFEYYDLQYEDPITWNGKDREGKNYKLQLHREATVFGMISAVIRISWNNPDISDSEYIVDIPSSLKYVGIVIPKTIVPTTGLLRISQVNTARDIKKLVDYGIEVFDLNDNLTAFTSSQLIVLCDTLETISFYGLPKYVQDKHFKRTAKGLWLLENDARIL